MGGRLLWDEIRHLHVAGEWGAESREFTQCSFKNVSFRSSHCGSAEMNLTSIHKDTDSIPGLAQWVKDPALLQLQHRSPLQLGSSVAVAVA